MVVGPQRPWRIFRANFCTMALFPPTRYRTDGPRPAPRRGAVACAEATSESDNVTTQYGPLAQLVARLVRIEEVRSSNLLGSTTTSLNSTFSQKKCCSGNPGLKDIELSSALGWLSKRGCERVRA